MFYLKVVFIPFIVNEEGNEEGNQILQIVSTSCYSDNC